MNDTTNEKPRVAVVGGGPAGLIAAETMARAGLRVHVFERMPSPGRKLLMAGRGGLNITHSEPLERFRQRYGDTAGWMAPYLDAFPPAALVEWCAQLGQDTFVGSSGRIFPKAMKASPLLRSWLGRLDSLGVHFTMRADWRGWTPDGRALAFADGASFMADATVLALGGASWPRLGADGSWTELLPDIDIAPLRAANCGFRVAWSDMFRRQHAGSPLKRIALDFRGESLRGEALVTADGIEGGAVYALSAKLRDAIARDGEALLQVDLRPDMTVEDLSDRLDGPRRGATLSNFLRKRINLPPVGVGLVQEALHAGSAHTAQSDGAALARLVKAIPLRLTAPFGLERAISTAGGIALHELGSGLMLRKRPGVFVAGEMLDWEAPTGGYLLQACLATGRAAGEGAARWLSHPR